MSEDVRKEVGVEVDNIDIPASNCMAADRFQDSFIRLLETASLVAPPQETQAKDNFDINLFIKKNNKGK